MGAKVVGSKVFIFGFSKSMLASQCGVKTTGILPSEEKAWRTWEDNNLPQYKTDLLVEF